VAPTLGNGRCGAATKLDHHEHDGHYQRRARWTRSPGATAPWEGDLSAAQRTPPARADHARDSRTGRAAALGGSNRCRWWPVAKGLSQRHEPWSRRIPAPRRRHLRLPLRAGLLGAGLDRCRLPALRRRAGLV